jgi:hypothetical protein
MNVSEPEPMGGALPGMVLRRCLRLVGAALLLLCAGGCLRTRHSSQFLIPDGYVGWANVSYGVSGAPALSVEGGYYVVRLPANGQMQTSTEIEGGRAGDQFFYVKGDQRRRLQPSAPGGGGLIWGDGVTGQSRGATREFFVGPEKAFRKTHPP